MTSKINWTEIERKAYQDAQQDGLMELLSGLGMLYLAGMVSGKLSVAFFALIVVFFSQGLEALRKRYTYPRIGYVKLPEAGQKEIWRVIFLLMLGLLVIVSIILVFVGEAGNFESWLKWLPAFLGIVYVGMFLSLASKSKTARYYGYALISVISGFAFSLLTFESWRTGVELYFLSLGLILIINGIFLFLRFLRKNPLPLEGLSSEQTNNTTT